MRLGYGLILALGGLLPIALVASAPAGPSAPGAIQAAAQAPVEQGPPAASAVDALREGDAEHGKYIVEHVAMCIECHSGRDAEGTILPAERYMGGWLPMGSPWPGADWALRAPRIHGLPGYSDELAIRLLTHGAIDRRGIQLRSPMPKFRMSREDAADVVRYLKSLPTTY